MVSMVKISAELSKDEKGFIVSMEVALLATIAIVGLLVSLTTTRDAVTRQFAEISSAVQGLSQQYSFNGSVGRSSSTAGSSFAEQPDWCDDSFDSPGAVDNCITFSAPSDESDSGGGTGGGDDGGDDGGGGGGDDGGGEDFGTPANGDLVSDNFQDGNGNAPFNLQVRNTTNSATDFVAVLPSVPYASIPGLNPGNYDLQITPNGDGTFQYVFTGTTPLGPFQNIIIAGGLPTPPGVGGASNVDLFIQN